MDIIKRNFIKLMCSGTLHEYDQIEPMSNYKWNKLIKMGLSQNVISQISAGTRNNPFVPQAMPQSVVDEIVASNPMRESRLETASSQLYNPLSRRRLRLIRDIDTSSEDFSMATVQLLNIFVKNASDTFSMGFSYSGVLPIAIFLREEGENVDFVTFEKWLGKLGLHHFAQFVGSVLVLTLNFDKDEVPFLQSIDKDAYRIVENALDCCDEVRTSDWNVHQTSVGFVETNAKAMLQSVKNSIRFFHYSPIEVVCNFVHCLVVNISEIEE